MIGGKKMKQIILKQLTLKNFKGIKDLTIDFTNLTNVKGDNGTGKSTIADAFTWLLFDKDSQDRKDFEIKTLDCNNEVIHGLEHGVIGILNVDGKDITLLKIYKEKWQKKRGEAEKQLTGHETLYYIDEVPAKKSDYQAKVNELVDENVFKLITNPLFFSLNMSWKDRRSIILSIIGDIETENIINYKTELEPLKKLLEDKDIEALRKYIAALKKKLNDDIKAIPIRIDEDNNSIKDYDFKALEIRKQEIMVALNKIDDELLDSSKSNESLLAEKDKLYNFKSQLRELEYKAREKAQKPLIKLREELRNIESETEKIDNKLYKLNATIDGKIADRRELSIDVVRLREKWADVNSRQLIFGENEFVCPTCKRELDPADINTKKQEMQGNFQQDKSKKLAAIKAEGKTINEKIEKFNIEIDELNKEKDTLTSKYSELTQHQADLKEQIANFKIEENVARSGEEMQLMKQISDLETKLSQPTTQNTMIVDLREKKSKLQQELEEINSQLAYKDINAELRNKIEKLQDDERILAQRIADLEKQEYLTEEFIKTKVELLESSINSKFKFVKFRLFNTLVNGAIEECCEALIDGVPFGNANTASQINAGIDIINVISEHYGVQAPIFIDNRESVNQIIDCNSQLINLIVSKDKKLKVENIESEVA